MPQVRFVTQVKYDMYQCKINLVILDFWFHKQPPSGPKSWTTSSLHGLCHSIKIGLSPYNTPDFILWIPLSCAGLYGFLSSIIHKQIGPIKIYTMQFIMRKPLNFLPSVGSCFHAVLIHLSSLLSNVCLALHIDVCKTKTFASPWLSYQSVDIFIQVSAGIQRKHFFFRRVLHLMLWFTRL